MTAEAAIRDLSTPNGGIDPQIRAAATEVVLAAKAAGREVKAISWFNPKSTPEHHVPGMAGQKGVAVDFMCDRATGDFIADYLWTHRVRLGLCWEIWRDRIRSTSPGKPGTWQARNKGDHYDHVHGNFGHLVGTSGQGKVTKITFTPLIQPPLAGTVWLDLLVPGVTDSDSVRLVQRALGLTETGNYDDVTQAAVRIRQRSWGDDPANCDGLLGPKQTALLFAELGWRVDIRTDPSGQAPTPKPEEPPVPTRPRILAAGLNVLRRTDPEAGKKRLTWQQRLPGLLNVIKGAKPDLLLLQELDHTTAADIAAGLGQGWSYHRQNGIGIMWRQAVLERAGEPVAKLYSDRDNRYVTGVPLRHKPSGRTFTAWVTHLENDGDPNTDGHAARRLQTREFVTTVANYTNGGAAIMGGDLNSTTAVVANPTTRQKEKPRLILAAAGWTLLSQGRTTKVINGKLESHWGGRKTDNITNGPWIDDLGVKGGPKIITSKLHRTDPTRCSDHHLLAAEIDLMDAHRLV